MRSWHSPATVSGYDIGNCHCPDEYRMGRRRKSVRTTSQETFPVNESLEPSREGVIEESTFEKNTLPWLESWGYLFMQPPISVTALHNYHIPEKYSSRSLKRESGWVLTHIPRR